MRYYIGKVPYKDKVYSGQHNGIIDPYVYNGVQMCLKTLAF